MKPGPATAASGGPVASPIAVLLPSDVMGGHERMLFEWLAVGLELGLRPIVHGGENRQIAELAGAVDIPWRDAGYRIDRRDRLRLAQWGNFVRTLWTAMRLPRGTAILLAPGAMQIGLLHILACRLARRDVVCYVPITQGAATLGMNRPALRDWLAVRMAQSVAMWITITDEHRRRLMELWKVRAPVHVIPNRLAVMSHSAARPKALLSEAGRLRLLYAGRFEEKQKGLDWLVEVLEANEPWAAQLSIEFQGKGPFVGALEAFARRAGSSRVKVLPWGSTQEALARADVLLLTSRFEGLPLVAIEALWAGVPVIASVESGLPEVLPRECLFPFGDVAALRAALERMRVPERREEAVIYGRDRLGILLDPERYRRALLGVIEGLALAANKS
jgi:glycosyltransferase involved in cell wall biosynthesis